MLPERFAPLRRSLAALSLVAGLGLVATPLGVEPF